MVGGGRRGWGYRFDAVRGTGRVDRATRRPQSCVEHAWDSAPHPASEIQAADLYPDAVDCLRELMDAGFRIGLAGNQPRTSEVALDRLGLGVSFIASSAAWGVAKPSPEFFERVIHAAEAPAGRIAYVGDRLDNDIIPAREAGMFAVFLRRGPWGYIHAGWPEVSQAHARIQSLQELPGIASHWRERLNGEPAK